MRSLALSRWLTIRQGPRLKTERRIRFVGTEDSEEGSWAREWARRGCDQRREQRLLVSVGLNGLDSV